MTDKLEALKAAALAATPGPWYRSSVTFNGITSEHTFMTQGNKPHIANAGEKRDAIFIAQANPAAVLELLAALEEKDKEVKRSTARLRELECDLADRGGIVAEQAKRNAELEQQLSRTNSMLSESIAALKAAEEQIQQLKGAK